MTHIRTSHHSEQSTQRHACWDLQEDIFHGCTGHKALLGWGSSVQPQFLAVQLAQHLGSGEQVFQPKKILDDKYMYE